MMKPAIRGEVLMADGPEMYRLYVECRNCKTQNRFEESVGPPLTALAVQLTCPSCNFEAVYPPADIQLGILTQMSNITSARRYSHSPPGELQSVLISRLQQPSSHRELMAGLG
jgi:RNase P subunit RPR2